MEKDCKIIFTNKTTYDFPYGKLTVALKTIKEKGWKVMAIHTPYGVLTTLSEEEYKQIISAFAEKA